MIYAHSLWCICLSDRYRCVYAELLHCFFSKQEDNDAGNQRDATARAALDAAEGGVDVDDVRRTNFTQKAISMPSVFAEERAHNLSPAHTKSCRQIHLSGASKMPILILYAQ